ncbi:hypothetical protein VCHC55A1_1809 [Vibrio cholerae HC-55A1]|nr:hypothetical protein VCHC55A1_1809 [Vibrio cholerae HC-55A1]EKG70105.1 hypothetical protein VCHC57A1_1704 [Vibrio cholerae HC-57A1]
MQPTFAFMDEKSSPTRTGMANRVSPSYLKLQQCWQRSFTPIT